jgi:hypothetical protein
MLAISIFLREREGHVEEAINVAASMPCQPNNFVWGHCLVVASPLWSRFGSIFIRFLLRDPGNSAGHVMLDNVFAVDHRWDTVLALRWFMRENGVKNQPRCSWISIDGIVHQFHVGSHTQIERIY